MLVLSRQRDEAIVIGDNIVVTVIDIRGDKVRFGIEAPTEVSVHRREVYEATQRESPRALSKEYQQLRQYLERGDFCQASLLYRDNPTIRGLISTEDGSRLEKGLGRKLK